MSQTSARSTVFLTEMGVGPQWKLRNPPPSQELAEDEVQAEQGIADIPAAVAAPVIAPVVASAQAPVAAPFVAPVAAPAPVVAAPAPVATVDEAPADDAFIADDNADMDDDSNAWFDDAPAPPRAAPVSDAAIAAMDWPALQAAVSSCTRCDLCATRRSAVPGRGPAQAPWLAISAGPSRQDEKDRTIVSGEAGQLLDNMLKAIALAPESDVYVTSLLKCRPTNEDGTDRPPSADELAACRPYLERELALTGATMVMTFGQYAARGLLGAVSRGKVHRYGELPVVATYHPDDLLRKPEDKAKAWADLCLAKSARD